MEKNGRKLLIVDDDKSVLKALELLLEPDFKKVQTISNPNLIPGIIRFEQFAVILLDMNFSAGVSTGNEGLFWLRKILKSNSNTVVVLITAYGDVELAVKAIKEGATDFILKPWDNEKLKATVHIAVKLYESRLEVEKLKSKQKHLKEDIEKQYQQLVGSSPAMKEVLQTVKKVARTDANILILGENGTGKELIAREIHRQSARSEEVLISVDVAALSETLFESELFGHKRGSFTDAKEDRKGRFETASGGTLFLDEIGNLSISLQAKLLAALENREITPLGSNTPIPVDIRLISATNKPVSKMVKENVFREDLLYRINTIQIELPPLREIRDDILLLTEFFLKQFAQKYEKPFLKIDRRAMDKLKRYSWPGNVRELKHTVEKAVILCESDVLKPEDFLTDYRHLDEDYPRKAMKLEELEKQAIINALRNNYGILTDAAKELGIARQTIYNKMQKYGL